MTSNAPTRYPPIFLLGAPRSGTTMLRYMLCAHPHIYIPPESNFMLRFLPHPADQALSRANALWLMRAVFDYKVFFRDWQGEMPEPEEYIDSIPDLKPATLLDRLYREYARQNSAGRWGDKSPIYATHVGALAVLFPQAQFIHLIRDGRSVALSMLRAYSGPRFFYMDLCYAALTWRHRVRSARSAGSALGPDRYLETRYEHVTTAPREALQRICGFLDEPFASEMLAPHREANGHYHSRGIHAATRRPLTNSRVGRWCCEMTSSDQRLFRTLAGDLLAELGYDPGDTNRLSLSERLHLAGLRSKYMLVELARRLLRAIGVVHPAHLSMRMAKR